MTDFDVGQLLPTAVESSGTSGLRLGVVGRRAARGAGRRTTTRNAGARRSEPSVHSLTRSTTWPSAEAERGDVVGVHEHDAAAAGEPAVAVVEAVDRGVELVVAAQRLQQQAALGHVRARRAG